MKECEIYKKGEAFLEKGILLCPKEDCPCEMGKFHKANEEKMYAICSTRGMVLEEKDIPYIC